MPKDEMKEPDSDEKKNNRRKKKAAVLNYGPPKREAWILFGEAFKSAVVAKFWG